MEHRQIDQLNEQLGIIVDTLEEIRARLQNIEEKVSYIEEEIYENSYERIG